MAVERVDAGWRAEESNHDICRLGSSRIHDTIPYDTAHTPTSIPTRKDTILSSRFILPSQGNESHEQTTTELERPYLYHYHCDYCSIKLSTALGRPGGRMYWLLVIRTTKLISGVHSLPTYGPVVTVDYLFTHLPYLLARPQLFFPVWKSFPA